jgi:hypothetical protein
MAGTLRSAIEASGPEDTLHRNARVVTRLAGAGRGADA